MSSASTGRCSSGRGRALVGWVGLGSGSVGQVGVRTIDSIPDDLPASTPPGRLTGPWPRQRVSRSSTATTCARVRRTGRAAGGHQRAPQHPAPHRGVERDEGGHRQAPAGRAATVGRGGVEGVGVLAQLGGRAGQRRGDPRPELGLEHRAAPGAAPAPGPWPGRRSPGRRGRAGRGRPGRRGRWRAGSSSSGRRYRPRTAAMPASERAPEPRASPSSTCSAWSSRVCPSRTATAPCRSATSSRAA